MKILLSISLCLNAVLAVAWLVSPRPVSTMQAPPAVPVAVASSNPAPAVAETAVKPWALLTGLGPEELSERLREAGCPDQTIRDILVLQICRKYRARLLEEEARAIRDWDVRKPRSAKEWREQSWVRQQMREEMITEIENLTGRRWTESRDDLLGWPSTVSGPDYLPLEKRQRVRQVELKFSEPMQEVQTKAMTAGWDPETRSKWRELNAEKEKAISAVLSPAEMEDYRMRESAAMEFVRANLPEAKDEAEFKAMVKVAGELGMFNEGRSMAARYGIGSDVEDKEQKQKQSVLAERLKEVLGADRVEQQQKAEQARQQAEAQAAMARQKAAERARLQAMAASLGASEEGAGRFFDRIVELQPVLDAKFKDLEKTLTGTPEEKTRRMKQAMREELEPIAKDMVGDKAGALLDKVLGP